MFHAKKWKCCQIVKKLFFSIWQHDPSKGEKWRKRLVFDILTLVQCPINFDRFFAIAQNDEESQEQKTIRHSEGKARRIFFVLHNFSDTALDMVNVSRNKKQSFLDLATVRQKSAFTLMEILVAMTVFGIVTLGLVLPFQESISLTTRNNLISNANNLARLYLKKIELSWLTQSNFDNQVMPNVTNEFTDKGIYDVDVAVTNLDQNTDNAWILKRVNITYSDTEGTELVNFFMDYNRPGS